MISEWGYQVMANVVSWFLTLLPGFSTDVSGGGPASIIAPVAAYAADLSGWIPWSTAAVWFPVVITLYIAALIGRAMKSFLPTMSG